MTTTDRMNVIQNLGVFVGTIAVILAPDVRDRPEIIDGFPMPRHGHINRWTDEGVQRLALAIARHAAELLK